MADRIALPYRTLVLRMGELWLKGRNRNTFKRRLQRNLSASLRAVIPEATVHLHHARLVVDLPDGAPVARAVEICCDTPGLTWVSPAIAVASEVEAIEAAALALADAAWVGAQGSFRVDTRRSDKAFPLASPALNARIGGQIAVRLGLSVDLKVADRTLGIDVTRQGSYVYVHRLPAAGGLPIGTAGRALLLLSGGLDSPVAGYGAQRRGCEIEAIYFHSPPFISEASKDKVIALAKLLAPRQGGLRLHVIPFTAVQLAVRDASGGKLTVLLYRRFMYRIAAQLARRARIPALVTGENLSQVASQTIENLSLAQRGLDTLVLRPLICADKLDIVATARRIGTHDVSILPHEDCCTLFIPPNPATRAPMHAILTKEARMDVDGLVEAALAEAEVITL